MNLENIIFDLIDEFKFLYFPEEWSGKLFDFTKNELFVLIFLYKNKESNMTKIADYINSPLNTATGVVNRMVKKELLERRQSQTDRRTVIIKLTQKATKMLDTEFHLIQSYFSTVYNELTQEEISVVFNIITKVRKMLKDKSLTNNKPKNIVRKIEIE